MRVWTDILIGRVGEDRGYDWTMLPGNRSSKNGT